MLYQNPSMKPEELLRSEEFSYAKSTVVSDQADHDYMEFTI